MAKKILIVDDSTAIRNQVTYFLEKSGFMVIGASDGVNGLQELSKHSDIAMVISDVNMPNMDGLQMLAAIKAQTAYASLPVIMLTTEGSSELISQAKSQGAKGWMVKPFQPDHLVATATKFTA